ncbi:hypothetical protein [Gaoshiqia sediminis]|uniref:hypothetical protein n=1 Tax=Gaoshiqia sediminis TaxID=2986998 RepID=UPI0024A6865E|nr:hypothetical protein [Gaoshiqia sediminis]
MAFSLVEAARIEKVVARAGVAVAQFKADIVSLLTDIVSGEALIARYRPVVVSVEVVIARYRPVVVSVEVVIARVLAVVV